MHRAMWGAKIVVLSFVLLLIASHDAHAYLDPGSGSYFFQVVLATFVSAFVAVKLYWGRIVSFVARRFSGPSSPEDEQNKPAN